MKKIISCMLFTLLLWLCFCACDKQSGEIKYAVWLEQADEDCSWTAEVEKQGIVELAEHVVANDGSEMFLYEGVGEGETAVKFYCTASDKENAKKTVVYYLSVDSDYNVHGKKASEDEAPVTEAMKLTSRQEAEAYVASNVGSRNSKGEALTVVYDCTERENGESTYFFDVFKTVKKSDGKMYMVYVKTVSVKADGTLDEYVKSQKPSDIPVSEK